MNTDKDPARSYSDNAIRGAIRSLKRMFNRGEWGDRRLRALEQRHAVLESRIAAEDNRPRPDADQLSRLKKEKLRLKEEMERIRRGEVVH
jgi:hypothetical protein